jgi:DNA-binding MarR family transcriptional regulator
LDDELLERAARLERIFPQVMRAIYWPHAEDPLSELSVAQIRLVRMLYLGSRSHSAIGEELGISLSAVTQLVNRLEREGIVERVEDESDRRIKIVRLTAKGQAMMRERQERRVNGVVDVLSKLSTAEQETILTSLERLSTVCAAIRTETAQPQELEDLDHSALSNPVEMVSAQA